jgi:hypothetical protein
VCSKEPSQRKGLAQIAKDYQCRGEPGSIEIKQYRGSLANVLWVIIGGQRYPFVYNHDTGEIGDSQPDAEWPGGSQLQQERAVRQG